MSTEHALLVGGSRGLGRVTALDLDEQGIAVSILARRPPEPGLPDRITTWSADICHEPSLRQTLPEIVRRHGPPTRVVFFQRHRANQPDWEQELATTLGATRRTLEILVHDHQLRDCAVVLVSSVNSRLISPHLPPGYHVAKAGLVQLARYYAVQLGPRGIRVNSVSPGTFLKPESQHLLLEDVPRRQFHEGLSPLGRIGSAKEVARVIRFLSGPDASFVTGQDLVVDGGVSLRFQETLPSPNLTRVPRAADA